MKKKKKDYHVLDYANYDIDEIHQRNQIFKHSQQWIKRGVSCTFPYWDRKRNEEIKKENIRYKKQLRMKTKKETRMIVAGNKNTLKIHPNVLVQSFMQALV